ncbi:MAG: asparagine synthase-related protein, partial [Acidobacteria bacterium]|nr:asparagine synthase-related protein [Acidobacteriota bacterium]
GKKILREAFADLLPTEIACRVKTPIEFGSGSTALARVAVEAISDEEFNCARERIAQDDGVGLRDKEQYFYYRLYRQIFPAPRDQPRGMKTCPECQGPVPRVDMTYCRLCGAYPT